eukprot:jgi/Psemu1/2496/gm1.2496_g
MANTYSFCVEQPIQHLFRTLSAIHNNKLFAGDAENTFAHSPTPNVPTYVSIDNADADWYKWKYNKPIDCSLVFPIQHALQSHPQSGHLWEEHINHILTSPKLLGFNKIAPLFKYLHIATSCNGPQNPNSKVTLHQHFLAKHLTISRLTLAPLKALMDIFTYRLHTTSTNIPSLVNFSMPIQHMIALKFHCYLQESGEGHTKAPYGVIENLSVPHEGLTSSTAHQIAGNITSSPDTTNTSA